MKTRDLILKELATRPGTKTFEELNIVLRITYDALRGAINRLLKAGTIEKNAAGEYFIPAKAAPKTPPFPKVAPLPPKHRLTKNILVLDNSGSMVGIRHEAKKSFDQTLQDLKDNAQKYNEMSVTSTYLFGTEITRVQNQVNTALASPLGSYYPDEGGTRLFDAVGRAINDHKFVIDPYSDVSYLLIVITDGDENQSSNFNQNTLNDLMTQVQATDKWTITFQLPKGAKRNFCSRFNIPEGNVMEWEQNEDGVRQSTIARSAGVGSYYAARSQGASKVSNFYTVNANDIKARDLNRKLDNVAGQTKSWNVEREVEIKPFVESHLGYYTPGTAFYQLTKTEEVQSYKQILVQKKFTKEIYAGREARDLLGLPVGKTCKVKVGNLGDYDVFIQSTSVNRKLVRGTRVINFSGAIN